MAFNIVKHRRGTTQEWLEVDLIPHDGELVIEECKDGTRKCKIGDGINSFSKLPYLTDDVMASIAELSHEVELLDQSVMNLVQPSIGSLDAKYSQKLSEMATQHNTDVEALSGAVNAKAEELTTTFESAITEQSEAIIEQLEAASELLTNTFTNQIQTVDSDLRELVSETNQKHADDVDALNYSINELSTEIDRKIDNKVASSESQQNDAIATIRDSIRYINIVLAQLQQENNNSGGSGSGGTTTQPDSSTVPSDLVWQLEDLNHRVQQLETEDLSFAKSILDISSEVAALTNSVRSVKTQQTQQQTKYTELSQALTALDTKLSKAQTDFQNSINKSLTSLERQVSGLAAEDLNLSSRISEIKSDAYEHTEQVKDTLTENLIDTAAGLTTAINEAKAELSDNIDSALDAVDTAKNEFNSKITDLRDRQDIKITANANAVKTLESTVKTNYQNLNTAIDQASAVILSNKTSTNTNKKNIQQLSTTTENKLKQFNSILNNLDVELAAERNRIDEIVAAGTSNTTAEDAELIDIRKGYDGVDHLSAGSAVRAIGRDLNNLKASLPEYIPANAVDGLQYENNELYLVSGGVQVGNSVTITGGGGGGSAGSVVKVQNNLASNIFTIAKGSKAYINFTYTSFEEGVTTGDGACTISINDKKVDALTCTVEHGKAKNIDVTDYLKSGTNKIKVTCTDAYGVSRALLYTISVIELRIESSFDSNTKFESAISFIYKIFGQVEKTVHILIDDKEFYTNTLAANVHGKELTTIIPKQKHGSHKITIYITATIDDTTISSNVLEYDILCLEADNNAAVLTSTCAIKEATQGDLVSIPFMLYDPDYPSGTVTLTVYSKAGGELTSIYSAQLVVNREPQSWKTRNYPAGTAVFEISYTYDRDGVEFTITKTHEVKVKELNIDISAETGSLQLYLTAAGRKNEELNPAVWTFKPEQEGYDTITTTFENFNWKSNGWISDSSGDTCLRLNGDARATIQFKPFKNDFSKSNGKTIEFEFLVRDVNDREAIVIDCFEGERGFRATPDTAFLQSSGSKISCRYKEAERVRVAISIDKSSTLTRFVSIYLDGILSGVQRYAVGDVFNQNNAVNITLGSNLCGLDVYSIRVYDKALSAAQVLTNYIADQTEPSTKLQLLADNDILDVETNKISYEAVKAQGKIPIITFIGDMPTYKGDKKVVLMDFENPADPSRDFKTVYGGPIEVEIDVQGTSSQFYARKNWLIKLKKKKDDVVLFDHAPYQHMEDQIPAQVFCIKVDYAEATGTHNTGTANYVETLYDRSAIKNSDGVITDFTGPGWIPPQKDDQRVRTAIAGFPCIIFEKATEDSEPVFSSKANFNFDKGAENAFGFTKEYDDFGVECWEFCNNTSLAVNFAGPVPDSWEDDFEPRYVPESAKFDRIEDLLDIKADSEKDPPLATMTDAERQELASLQQSCIANFKEMHDWVLSTAQYTIDNGKRIPIVPKALDQAVTFDGITYEEDNVEYRRAKFKHEFEKYFNMHYCSIYYVFTFVALMTDQRAKNMFLTRWKDGIDEEGNPVYHWYPYFYDNDTIFGINNEGALVFDYYHEDIDRLGSSNVYNGQNSVLWNNFRECFLQQIKDTYAELRSSKKLTYDGIIEQFVTKGSDTWSAAVYNEDAEYKYISMARVNTTLKDESGNEYIDVDASNLYQVRGPGEHHLKYFVANRLNYCDSKWNAGDYPSNFFFLRIYTPAYREIDVNDSPEQQAEQALINASIAAVPPDPSITVEPFSDMYAGVKYKANGTLQQKRLKAGETHTFSTIDATETFNDTETAIYGASELASLGDLSKLYCGVVNLVGQNTGDKDGTVSSGSSQGYVKENKLVELIIGNHDPNYYNDNFREVAVGTCKLLKKIDLTNCSGLGIAGKNPQKTLELGGCPNIEEIYAKGTNLTYVELPDSGYVRTLHLPASINTLKIRNQKYITDFSIESYANIKTLEIEDCPTLNTNQILEACRQPDGKYTVELVHLTGISWGSKEAPLENADFIKTLFPTYDEEGNLIGGIRSLNDQGELVDAYIEGVCYIKKLTGAEYTEIKSHYPYLDIKFGELTSTVTFNYTDADGNDHVQSVTIEAKDSTLGTCEAPTLIHTPAWPENDAFKYEHVGWSRKLQVSKGVEDHEDDYKEFLQADALLNIAGDRMLYPVFKALRKSYKVEFYNLDAQNQKVLLYTDNAVPYGSAATYAGAVPTKQDTAASTLYSFTGWNPAPDKVIKNMECFAQFAILDSTWYTIGLNDISNCVDTNGQPFDGYVLNTTNHTMSITECNNNFNSAVKIPSQFNLESGTFNVTSVGGFANHNNLVLINLPNTLTELLLRAFYNCYNLTELTLPESVRIIGSKAFQGCNKLKEIVIPAAVNVIGEAAFADCANLTNIMVDEHNLRYKMEQNCLIDMSTGTLLQGLTNAVIPMDGSIYHLAQSCFSRVRITAVTIPDVVSIIPANAFSYCDSLVSVKLPSELRTLDATCFAWCSNLREIELPNGLVNIQTYVFDSCALGSVTIPGSVENVLARSFGDMASLHEVTFEKRTDANGNAVLPYIHHNAFINSGSAEKPITFNLPWTKEQHLDAFDGTYTDSGVVYRKDPFFGARVGSVLNFADGETMTNGL